MTRFMIRKAVINVKQPNLEAPELQIHKWKPLKFSCLVGDH